MKLTICNRIITLHIGRTPKGSRCRILPELKVFGRLRHDRASYYLVWMFWVGNLIVIKWDYEKGYDPYNSEIVIEKKVKPTTL